MNLLPGISINNQKPHSQPNTIFSKIVLQSIHNQFSSPKSFHSWAVAHSLPKLSQTPNLTTRFLNLGGMWIFKWLFGSMDLLRIFSIGFSLALSCTIQILLGFILCWIYNNNLFNAFNNISYNILEFEFGTICRSFHISMTSFIYILLYTHILKVSYLALVFDSSFLIWTVGFIIFINLIIIAFIGYILPMSQLSYWGLVVFSNILATFPYIGNLIINWLWGCEYINEWTLIKIHMLHIVLPLEMLFIILLHLICLHYFISSDSSDRFIFYIERFILVLL